MHNAHAINASPDTQRIILRYIAFDILLIYDYFSAYAFYLISDEISHLIAYESNMRAQSVFI